MAATQTESAEDTELELGGRIRAARQAAGLTLQQVAEEAGVSRSLLSQVERGLASPSIATLRGVASALGIQVGSLFYNQPVDDVGVFDADGRRILVRRDERKSLQIPRSRVRYELLTPDLNRNIEFIWIEYGPGDASPYNAMGHEGEENAICLEGQIVVTIDDREFVLNAGDSISFDCSRPHRVENRTDETAIVISAITPPSF